MKVPQIAALPGMTPLGIKPRTTLVREFSACGPCITLGRFVKESKEFFFYDEWKYGDVYGGTKRKKKRGTLVHIEPCRSCRDHTETSYPRGYED